MSDQLALQFGETISQRFAKFHAANPGVYVELERRALALYRAGRKHIGIALIYEAMRYEWLIRIDHADDWRLNNDYRALYARLLIAEHPELAGVIETRERRAA